MSTVDAVVLGIAMSSRTMSTVDAVVLGIAMSSRTMSTVDAVVLGIAMSSRTMSTASHQNLIKPQFFKCSGDKKITQTPWHFNVFKITYWNVNRFLMRL